MPPSGRFHIDLHLSASRTVKKIQLGNLHNAMRSVDQIPHHTSLQGMGGRSALPQPQSMSSLARLSTPQGRSTPHHTIDIGCSLVRSNTCQRCTFGTRTLLRQRSCQAHILQANAALPKSQARYHRTTQRTCPDRQHQQPSSKSRIPIFPAIHNDPHVSGQHRHREHVGGGVDISCAFIENRPSVNPAPGLVIGADRDLVLGDPFTRIDEAWLSLDAGYSNNRASIHLPPLALFGDIGSPGQVAIQATLAEASSNRVVTRHRRSRGLRVVWYQRLCANMQRLCQTVCSGRKACSASRQAESTDTVTSKSSRP